MSYLFGIIALVLGWGVFQYHKRGQAEDKLDDTLFNTKLKDIRDGVLANNKALESEEAKRTALSDGAAKEEKKDVSNEEIIDFLNNTTPKP